MSDNRNMWVGASTAVQRAEIGIYSDFAHLAHAVTGARAAGAPVLVQHDNYGAGHIAGRAIGSQFALDVSSWRKRPPATVAVPHDLLDPGQIPLKLDLWAEETLKTSRATYVLAPTRFIPAGAWDVLVAAVNELCTVRNPRMVPFLPLDASWLDAARFPSLLSALVPLRQRRIALLFAGSREELADPDRLRVLRRLVTAHSGMWLIGADPLVATDALAHGAGAVFVGVRSGLRWPAAPGADNGGFFAQDAIPGTFNRSLLAMCSPSRYADWYAARPSPSCRACARPLDSFTSSDTDKAEIAVHNCHASIEFGRTLLAQPTVQRMSWLRHERHEAFVRHTMLNPLAASVDADRTLRSLVEIDDPLGRRALPTGSFV